MEEAASIEDIRRVPCHRDFGPHNWLVECATLSVIDWEHARPDAAVTDLERATELMGPDPRRAFFEGYGADLTLLESPLFRAQVAMAALARIAWAVPKANRAFEESGRARLAAALAAST